jgi:hypothetical protein
LNGRLWLPRARAPVCGRSHSQREKHLNWMKVCVTRGWLGGGGMCLHSKNRSIKRAGCVWCVFGALIWRVDHQTDLPNHDG